MRGFDQNQRQGSGRQYGANMQGNVGNSSAFGQQNSGGNFGRRVPYCSVCRCEHPYGEHIVNRPYCSMCNAHHEPGYHVTSMIGGRLN